MANIHIVNGGSVFLSAPAAASSVVPQYPLEFDGEATLSFTGGQAIAPLGGPNVGGAVASFILTTQLTLSADPS